MNPENSASVRELAAELVAANHILFRHGVVDAFGHVSARHPLDPTRFLMSIRIAPARVERDSIIELDLNGSPLHASDRPLYLERFIHGEIYRARTDVAAVVHSHSPSMIPFGVVTSVPLRPLSHACGFMHPFAPVFEPRHLVGNSSDLLISNASLGRSLAQTLGQNAVVLMRGHGATVVGSDIREAVFRAIYAELNAKLQSEALRLGEPVYLSAGEAMASTKTFAPHIERAWLLWMEQLTGAAGPSDRTAA